jgi:hypothetical protein
MKNNIKNMKTFDEFILETKGEHDNSKVYDDLYSDVEKHLKRWGAGPVYGWKGSKGIAFSVSKGKNVKPNDWIVINYIPHGDSLTITLYPYGTDSIETARDYREYVLCYYYGCGYVYVVIKL